MQPTLRTVRSSHTGCLARHAGHRGWSKRRRSSRAAKRLQSVGAPRSTGAAWREAHLGEHGEQSSGSQGRMAVERTSIFVKRFSLRGALREAEV